MPNRAEILPIDNASAPLARGVYWEQVEAHEETVYFAITSTGELLNGELRRLLPEETETMIAREMWRDLNRQDPAGATLPRLSLVR